MRRIAVLLLCCGMLAAAEPAPAAVPPSPVAQRALDLTARHRAFFDWALVDAFRRTGGQGPWRADAERFLGELGRCLALDEVDAHLPDLLAAGRKLLAAGCDDPLVRLRIGMLMGRDGDGPRLVGGSIAGLRAPTGGPAPYPGIQLIAALRRQLDPKTGKPTAAAAGELADLVAAAAREALAAPCGRAVAVDRVAEWLSPLFESGGLGKDDGERALAALAAPGGDPALAGVLRGRAAIRAAWDARGGGWAASVTEEGWKGFRAGLAEARRSLGAAWEACPDSAMAASLMIMVAMGDQAGDEAVWFDRALAADPGCPEAWKRMSTALLPRWGGSTAQLLALAQRASADARPGNRLGHAAGRVLALFVDEGGDRAAAWQEVGHLDRCCPPEPGPGRDFRAMGVDWYAGRRAAAQEAFGRLGGIAAPPEALDAAPFGRVDGMRLLGAIERARLGQTEPAARPIPADGSACLRALHTPSWLSLLPACWQAHGKPDPAWDGCIAALLAQRAARTSPISASELVAAGCRDPLVRYLACDEQPGQAAATRRAELLACWDGLEAAGYPPVVVWQPAWFLLRELHGDPAAAAERTRLTPRYAALATRLAASAGSDGVTPALIFWEMADPPARDPGLLDLVDQAAAAPGVEPALAAGLTGLTALARAERLGDGTPPRIRLACTAIGRLQVAWNAYHHPKAAAALATASCLAGMPTEARWWFDEAVRLAYDDHMPWSALIAGYALTGSPDELLAFGAEIAALPAASGATLRALDPVRSVLANRWLCDAKRLKSAWGTIDRVTAGGLADPALAAATRARLLYWRVTGAALAGDQPAVAAALAAIGAPYDPKQLPPGIDPARIDAAVQAAAPAAAAKPVDF